MAGLKVHGGRAARAGLFHGQRAATAGDETANWAAFFHGWAFADWIDAG